MVPPVSGVDFFVAMQGYLDNNMHYIERVEEATSQWRNNHDAMVEEFERLKARCYGFDQPPPPLSDD